MARKGIDPAVPSPRPGRPPVFGGPAVLLLFALIAGACAPAEPPPLIVTDGAFDDWGQTPILLSDPIDAPDDAAVDLGAVRLTDDPWWLFFGVELGRTVTPQAMRGTLHVVLDADGDAATGGRLHGMDGVDAVVQLSRREGPRRREYGNGNGIHAVTSAGPGPMLSGYEVALLVAPTSAASRVEMRVRRTGGTDSGLPPIGRGERIRVRLVFEGSDGVQDETPIGGYTLQHAASDEPEALHDQPIDKAPGTFRVVAWNVAGQQMWDEPEAVHRVLAALDPDVILLDETTASTTPASLGRYFKDGPLGALGAWRFVVGYSGGRQHGVVGTRLPMRASPELLSISYADSTLDELSMAIGSAAAQRLIPIERASGLATAGAWVEVGGREILFVPVDLRGGGHADSAEDRLRAVQATVIRDRTEEALRTSADPAVIIGGDLNLVGSEGPLSRLRSGLDRGGAPLAVAPAYRLVDRSQATWRTTANPALTPARLDFILYSGAVLGVDRAFPFDPEELTPALRAALGVEAGDARAVSPHLPVVTDFRVREQR